MKLDYAEIGRRIARRRKQQNLTQEFLAELVDVSPQYISHIEHARSIPSTEVIMKTNAGGPSPNACGGCRTRSWT